MYPELFVIITEERRPLYQRHFKRVQICDGKTGQDTDFKVEIVMREAEGVIKCVMYGTNTVITSFKQVS